MPPAKLSGLISRGLRVQWDPQQFMDSFDRQSIGALILDVRMPGISGLTLLDTLIEQGVDQPIILLTGHGTVDMCRRAFKAGAVEFLEKPVSDDVLLAGSARRQHAAAASGSERLRRSARCWR